MGTHCFLIYPNISSPRKESRSSSPSITPSIAVSLRVVFSLTLCITPQPPTCSVPSTASSPHCRTLCVMPWAPLITCQQGCLPVAGQAGTVWGGGSTFHRSWLICRAGRQLVGYKKGDETTEQHQYFSAQRSRPSQSTVTFRGLTEKDPPPRERARRKP